MVTNALAKVETVIKGYFLRLEKDSQSVVAKIKIFPMKPGVCKSAGSTFWVSLESMAFIEKVCPWGQALMS